MKHFNVGDLAVTTDGYYAIYLGNKEFFRGNGTTAVYKEEYIDDFIRVAMCGPNTPVANFREIMSNKNLFQ